MVMQTVKLEDWKVVGEEGIQVQRSVYGDEEILALEEQLAETKKELSSVIRHIGRLHEEIGILHRRSRLHEHHITQILQSAPSMVQQQVSAMSYSAYQTALYNRPVPQCTASREARTGAIDTSFSAFLKSIFSRE